MQYTNKEYDKGRHERFSALMVKQPYANRLLEPAFQIDGMVFAEKSIEIRSRSTKFRGDLLICSSAIPMIPGMSSSATIGFVELYDVKPISEFTEQDWEDTTIPAEERKKIKKGYGWMMRNPRRVIEMPVKGQLGIFNLVYTKGDIIEYPTICKMDKESWKLVKKQIQDANK